MKDNTGHVISKTVTISIHNPKTYHSAPEKMKLKTVDIDL